MFQIKKMNKIYLTKGDSASFKVDVFTKNKTAYELTSSDVIRLCVRKNANDEVLIEKTAIDGVFTLEPADTNSLAVGTYIYDIELKNGDVVNTIIPISFFEIGQEVCQ